jgi:hypothetical protein
MSGGRGKGKTGGASKKPVSRSAKAGLQACIINLSMHTLLHFQHRSCVDWAACAGEAPGGTLML